MATSAKISEKTKKLTEELSAQTGLKQIDVIEEAVVHYLHSWRIKKLNQSFDALKKDKKSFQSWKKEIGDMDGTLLDGLEND